MATRLTSRHTVKKRDLSPGNGNGSPRLGRQPPSRNPVTSALVQSQRSSQELAEDRTKLADDRTALAVTRTFVALDRTLMAWVRTATALVSFGFTIYKFFQQLRQPEPAGRAYVLGPRDVALVLIALGIGGLTLALVEHRKQSRQLRERFASYQPPPPSIAVGVATVMSGLGALAFVLVLLRL